MDDEKRWSELLEELTIQQQCLDMMNAGWIGDYVARGGIIHCGRGCHNCCSLAVNCTLTEAVSLGQAIGDAQLAAVSAYAERLLEQTTSVSDMKKYLQLQRQEMGMCPLLANDGACSAYAARPLSCRSLLSTKDSYWCGVDFASVPAEQKEKYLSSLDRSVTAFPLHYLASPQETGREFETRQLGHLQELFGFSCYGCMPVLVTLVRRDGLGEARSKKDAADIIEAAGFANPLLVSLLP